MLSRNDRLMTMKGADLINLADRLGIKVACNKARTQLKESKQGVIDRIIAAENVPEEVAEYNDVQKDLEDAENITVAPVPAVKSEKKRGRKSSKKSFEELVASIPMFGNTIIKRTSADSVKVSRGSVMFILDNKRIVTKTADAVKGLDFEESQYGYRLAPTIENMTAILLNG